MNDVVFIRVADARQCPLCGSSILQSWGRGARHMQAAGEKPANVGRYHCGNCGHTFRHYPDGEDRASLWIACANFYVITRYNRSRLYAAAVWHLAQAVKAAR